MANKNRPDSDEVHLLQTARGVRDLLPEDKIPRQQITDMLRQVFESFGYAPLETPALERLSVLTAKFAGGEGILKEIFRLKDQGNRNLGLRYDVTVPMARVVGMNPQLKMPFKRYQMQNVWRDGPIKLGRYREFLQCDVDIVGVPSMIADAEIVTIAYTVFSRLNLDVVIKINNRKLLNGILSYTGVKKGNAMRAILAIDKLTKIGFEAVSDELKDIGVLNDSIKKLREIFDSEELNEELLSKLNTLIKTREGKEGIKELRELFSCIKDLNIANVMLDISLARGLEYYTGTVFEAYLADSPVISSVAGGGRYDKMIGLFLGRGKYPAVGISFGIEPIYDALVAAGKIEKRKSLLEVYIIPIKTLKESMDIAMKLRSQGLKVDMDLLGRGISNNLSYANSMGIPFTLIIGPRELKEGKLKLRDMRTGEEEMLDIE
ncbi:histidine--tRNA ligase, partial [Candidatus Woesearchaeota archaeon CG08_land_8_20_14_0_20_47_9]